MGKAAKNERIKLRATFFNNVSVGLILAGCLIPYLALVQRLGEITDWMIHHGPVELTFLDWARIVTTVVAFFLALSGARHFRRAANKEIEKIQG